MSRHTPLSLLKNGRKFLSNESRWTTGTSHRNADGQSCFRNEAVKCCAAGAVFVSARYDRYDIVAREAVNYLHKAANLLFTEHSVASLNDRHGPDDMESYMNVLFAYEYAIELAAESALLKKVANE